MVLIKEIEFQLNQEKKKTDLEAVEDELIKDSVLELANADFTGEDFEVPQELGLIRKRAALETPLGPKYVGKPTSRRRQANSVSLEASVDQDEEDEGDEEDEDEQIDSEQSELEGDVEEEEEDEGEDFEDDDEDMSEDEDSGMGLADAQKSFQSDDINIFSAKAKDVSEDVAKGRAIKNQLNLWENLLECRIKFQPSLVAVNKLFQTDSLKEFKSQLEPRDESVVNKAYSALADVLNKLIDLQEKLTEHSGDTAGNQNAKSDDDDESIASSEASGIDDDPDDPQSPTDSKETTEAPPRKKRKTSKNIDVVQEKYADFAKTRDESIQKWYDRTRVASGKISTSDFSAFQQTTLKQIEATLYDKARLVKKTQMKRSVYEILGKTPDPQVSDVQPVEINQDGIERVDVKSKAQNDYDEEIFDDDDFYHKLLRDFVERSCTEAGGLGELAKQRQWLELQKLRSKMKRKVDTKASKGRKLRYTVHNKLVNFMAPIPTGTWTEDAERKLFASLFGRAG